MTEPTATYQLHDNSGAVLDESLRREEANLIRRVRQLRRECNGRGRFVIDVVFIDAATVIMVSTPGTVEVLGDG